MRLFGIALAFLSLALFLDTNAKGGDKKGSSPKEAIAAQYELLKAGKADELKAWFTDRIKIQITPAAVAKGQKEVAKFTLDDLVMDVQKGTFMGRETAKIKMKGGKTLTTLVLTEGKWLADTVWFK